jgi:hypothetical protein
LFSLDIQLHTASYSFFSFSGYARRGWLGFLSLVGLAVGPCLPCYHSDQWHCRLWNSLSCVSILFENHSNSQNEWKWFVIGPLENLSVTFSHSEWTPNWKIHKPLGQETCVAQNGNIGPVELNELN